MAKVTVSLVTIGLLAIIAGILVIALPRFVEWVIGIFLIVWGIMTLLGKK